MGLFILSGRCWKRPGWSREEQLRRQQCQQMHTAPSLSLGGKKSNRETGTDSVPFVGNLIFTKLVQLKGRHFVRAGKWHIFWSVRVKTPGKLMIISLYDHPVGEALHNNYDGVCVCVCRGLCCVAGVTWPHPTLSSCFIFVPVNRFELDDR